MPTPAVSSSSRLRIIRHDSPPMQWELAFSAPLPALRAYVREYVGWTDLSTVPIRRREVPTGGVPLIINFGSTVREYETANLGRWVEHASFTAGLHDSFTLVEGTGPGTGLQVNFTVLGARLFFDRPLDLLANCTVELDDVLGPFAGRLIASLYDAPTWELRFALLDREIASRLRVAREPAPAVIWAWQTLLRTGGAARIGDLVREIGWSRKHFVAQFSREIGQPPKTFARVLRFGRAVHLLTAGRDVRLADVAQECGYYDQAHFTRDFHAFAGVTPSALMASRLPAQAGFTS